MRRFRFLLAALAGVIAAAAPVPVPDLAAMLQDRLVRLEAGRLVQTRLPAAPRYIAFYFGASWCGPCRAFQPELKRGHARLQAARSPTEVIFVSDDADCRAMADYIRASRMTWPAIACRERARLAWLQRARGAALPGLLVYDAAGRQVITSWSRSGHSAPRRALAELEALANR